MNGRPIPRREADRVHSIAPLKLLSPRRLDLVCKYLFFRELASATGATDRTTSSAARLYEKHIIKRTGGIEPPDPFLSASNTVDKVSVADYVRHAKNLLASMKANGFDPKAAVTYFRDGTLGNGAHRISAALALDIPVFARLEEGQGTAWGFGWFLENDFTADELQTILYWYTQLKIDDVVTFVFYSPARDYWDLFAEMIAKVFRVVGQIDIPIDSPSGMYELVHDLYGTLEPLSSTGVINRKALLLAMTQPQAVRVLVAERRDSFDDIYTIATTAKNSCRELARDTVAPGSYLSAHAASSKAETLNLAGVLLSPNNLHQLGRRRSAGLRAEFGRWLGECREVCIRSRIGLDDICVVGSSPLEVLGVRPSTDIDVTVKSRYRKSHYGSGVSHLTPVVDIVTAGYHRSRERSISDDELIDNPDLHFRFRGLKFANPEIVLDQKEFYRRDKDVRDIEMARRVLDSAEPAPFNPTFELASCTETLIRQLTDGRPDIEVPTPPRLVTRVMRRSSNFLRRRARSLARRIRGG